MQLVVNNRTETASSWFDNGFIDEIQKLPFLMDEIHRIFEKYKVHFLLIKNIFKFCGIH